MKYNSQLREIAEAELLAGEVLLWLGQPSPLRLARRHLGTLLFGVVWGAVVLVLVNGISRFPMPMPLLADSGPIPFNFFLNLVLLVFFTVCLWFVSAPLRAYLDANRTIYAVTNRRAFIMTGAVVRSYYGRDMPFIRRRETGGGFGDVVFAETLRTRPNLLETGPNRRTYRELIGFFAIPHAQQVEALLLETFKPEPEPEPEKPDAFYRPWDTY